MPTLAIARPAVNEYAPYYGRYIDLGPQGGVLETLDRQHDTTMALLRSVKDDRGAHRYVAVKWSIADLVQEDRAAASESEATTPVTRGAGE